MITYDKNNKIFNLTNNKMSYIFCILKNGKLGNLYYGDAIGENLKIDQMIHFEKTSLTVNYFKNDDKFSMQNIKQEFPEYGRGDYREPAIMLTRENGSHLTDLFYKNHTIYKGKKGLEGLPSTRGEESCETLVIELYDQIIDLTVKLYYTIYKNINAITRHVELINGEKESVKINRLLSASIDFFDSDYQWLQFSGDWSRERHLIEKKLSEGITSIGSIKGTSSAEHNPFIILKRETTDEFKGEAYGFSFIYSGNFLAQGEVDSRKTLRMMMGINPFQFNWKLEKKESFVSPEVVLTYSNNGLNNLSHQLHDLYNKDLVQKKWMTQKRPVLINNWEATYFNFDENRILNIAKEAQQVGIDLFVLDDGWFGARNDDTKGLGDWIVNKEKLPNGIQGLSKKINDLGMKFGLWFEPEMVNEASNLFKEHPDYIISDPQRNSSVGRNQLVLDFSRKEVVDEIYRMMAHTLKNSTVEYIKWDMNRFISEPFGKDLGLEHKGEFFHRYILGLYSLLEKINENFPQIMIESCASGGNRFDPGLLYYAPQAWTSDNTDAISRLFIQYGTSYGYPISSIGSHVSEVPNHQVGRLTPLKTRTDVALFGTFGYELDIGKLSNEEKSQLKEDIKLFKENQEVIQKGRFYRLISPFETNNETAWICVSNNKEEALVGFYRIRNAASNPLKKIILTGLNPQYNYSVNGNEYSGIMLMKFGILLTDFYGENKVTGDYYSKLFVIKKI